MAPTKALRAEAPLRRARRLRATTTRRKIRKTTAYAMRSTSYINAGPLRIKSALLDRLHLAVALVRANDLFRVMHIHLAAEGFQVEGLVGGGGHNHKYNPLV